MRNKIKKYYDYIHNIFYLLLFSFNCDNNHNQKGNKNKMSQLSEINLKGINENSIICFTCYVKNEGKSKSIEIRFIISDIEIYEITVLINETFDVALSKTVKLFMRTLYDIDMYSFPLIEYREDKLMQYRYFIPSTDNELVDNIVLPTKCFTEKQMQRFNQSVQSYAGMDRNDFIAKITGE
jgi:hypothetical protein